MTNTQTATFTTQWNEPSTSVANEGEYGYFPAIDIRRTADNAPFHLHVYEDGAGGLVVHLYAPGVDVEVTVEHDSATARTRAVLDDPLSKPSGIGRASQCHQK